MKDLKLVAKRIQQFCPYDWAKDLDEVKRTLKAWIEKDDVFGKHLGAECGGFRFCKAKSGRRYFETMPVRIYVD